MHGSPAMAGSARRTVETDFMTEAEIKKFASDYAPKLAEDITKLCGSVIAKGLQGILEQCAEMQLRINELEATLIAHGIPIYGERGPNV